jgi:N-acetylglucosamine transport system substrate-binding protein
VQLSSALTSVSAAVKAAGPDLVSYRHRTWYPTLTKATDDSTGELINGRLTPQQWIDRMQRAADDVAKDASVKKYKRP